MCWFKNSNKIHFKIIYISCGPETTVVLKNFTEEDSFPSIWYTACWRNSQVGRHCLVYWTSKTKKALKQRSTASNKDTVSMAWPGIMAKVCDVPLVSSLRHRMCSNAPVISWFKYSTMLVPTCWLHTMT